MHKRMATGEMSAESEVKVRSHDTRTRTLGRNDTSGRHDRRKAMTIVSGGKKILEEDVFFGNDDAAERRQRC